MSRISGFKNKIKKLEEINNRLVKKLDLSSNRLNHKEVEAKEKEITLLKMQVKCKHEDVGNLQDKLYRANKALKEANELMVRAEKHIESLESKSIINRLKKLFA